MAQNHLQSLIASALALLMSKPDEELIDALNSGELYRMLAPSLGVDEVDIRFLRDANYTLETLTELYNASMVPVGHKALLPVESLYKPWTDDEESYPVVHGKKGLLMGDPALHMLELYRRAGFEIPEEFKAQPDHLILELEFLSILYENCPDTMVLQFMKDHLDWVPDLLAKCPELSIASFYRSVLRMLDAFIKDERSRLESLYEVTV
jgi:TorA maturation chaperone TorD